MKQYYLYINNNQIGPLSLDDLKQYAVSADTLVWYSGLPDWQKAGTLDDLKPFIKVTPPPIHSFAAATPPPVIHEKKYNEATKIFGMRKNIFLYGILGLAFIICIATFNSYSNTQDEISRQQQEIIYEQQRVARENRIKELSGELKTAYQSLELSKEQLHDATAFKLLRTAGERHEQVSAAEEEVNVWENKIAEIRRELNTLQ